MELRDRLILALDVDDLVLALRLADQLRPWFGVAKVGLEVFLDLKLHDIPTTVKKSARVAGALGASYLTLHARAGAVMLRAGVDGFREGAAAGGLPEPTALAVTILTSDADAPEHILGG